MKQTDLNGKVVTKDILARVRWNSGINIKLVTIPKHCDIKDGDLVKIVKVEEPNDDLSDELIALAKEVS